MLEYTIERNNPSPIVDEAFEESGTVDILAAEMRRLEAMPPDTGHLPDRMNSSALEEIELFQVRAGVFTTHVESLVRALQHDDDLQPVLVIRRGGRVFLVDGRHRKRAYEQAGRGDSVPVVEFWGTPREALLRGQHVNKLHTLAMTKDERMDCAWKLVKLDASKAAPYTLRQIVAVGVSRGQVTFMRRVLRELGANGFEHARWKEALRDHHKEPGREYTDDEIEDMMEVQAQEVADKMVRSLGTRIADRPEVLARAIEIFSGRRSGEVSRILNERCGSSDLDEEDEFEF